MAKTAILIDGSFYLKMDKKHWGDKTPENRADELHAYARSHITVKRDSREEDGKRSLYRIFFYDCPPVTGVNVPQPWNGKNTSLTTNRGGGKWRKDFLTCIATKRKVALRLGTISYKNARFVPTPEAMKALASGEKTFSDLSPNDFKLTGIKQEGVDMRIGLDVASLAGTGAVDQVVLIAGDSDFVPVMKYARRHGVDFILDPMGHPIHDKMRIQSDSIEDLSGEPFDIVDDSASDYQEIELR